MPKTIFGTTEKSNFILNMKDRTIQKLLRIVLLMGIILPEIGAILSAFTPLSSVCSVICLYIAGFSGLLVYLIVMLRGEIKFLSNKSYIIIVLIAVFTLVSYYGIIIRGGSDTMMKTSLFGEDGRYEGMIALFAYLGVFLAATCIVKYKDVMAILDTLIGVGILQAVIAVLQHIPNLNFPSDFNDLPYPYLTKYCYLSSGLADSPIFYGSFLTLVFSIALCGAIYDKDKKRNRVYAVSAMLFLLTGLFTSSIVAIIGIGSALLIAVVIDAVGAIKRRDVIEDVSIKVRNKKWFVMIASLMAIGIAVFYLQGIYIRDLDIAYSDAYYRLFIVNGPSLKVEHTLYEIAWGRSIEFIKAHPITGLGPDCMAIFQINHTDYSVSSIDRSYNEYLYIAATRGIPSLIAYISLLVFTIIKLAKSMKSFFANTENWIKPALLTAVIAYSIQGFFSASAITVAPFFWLLLGIACAARLEDTFADKNVNNTNP